MEHGFSEDIIFGPMSSNVFQETKLFSEMPKNLKELSEYPIG
jgi:hypothetical protein